MSKTYPAAVRELQLSRRVGCLQYFPVALSGCRVAILASDLCFCSLRLGFLDMTIPFALKSRVDSDFRTRLTVQRKAESGSARVREWTVSY
jgi:hypothetical protein